MKKFLLSISIIAGLLLLVSTAPRRYSHRGVHHFSDGGFKVTTTRIKVPFVENVGEVSRQVSFFADIQPGKVYLLKNGEVVYSLLGRGGRIDRIEEIFPGHYTIERGESSGVKVNFFTERGSFRDIPAYKWVSLVGKDVEIRFVASKGVVEKVFQFKDPTVLNNFVVTIRGALELKGDENGLVVVSRYGTYLFSKPIVYQIVDGKKKLLKAHYEVLDSGHYRFHVEGASEHAPLYVDPFFYATYLGGGKDGVCRSQFCGRDEVHSIYAGDGSVYIAGNTAGDLYVTSDAAQSVYGGGDYDVFIARVSDDLSRVESVTYYGGSGKDLVNSLLVVDDDLYIGGETTSNDLPGTYHGAVSTFTGAFGTPDAPDGFVAKFSLDLDILQGATYWGENGWDSIKSLAFYDGRLLAGGETTSENFPVNTDYPGFRSNTYLRTDGFIVAFYPDLTSAYTYTFFGGSGDDAIEKIVAANGYIYAGGWTDSNYLPGTGEGYQNVRNGSMDMFVVKFATSLTDVVSGTYLGGNGYDYLEDMYVTDQGDVYVTGFSDYSGTSNTFPIEGGFDESYNGNWDVVVARLSGNLSSLEASTFLGGEGVDEGRAISVMSNGNVVVAGRTNSTGFPVGDAFDTTGHQGYYESFVSILSPDLSHLEHSSFLGGSLDDEAFSLFVDSYDNIWVGGSTASMDFPVSSDVFDDQFDGKEEGFVAKLSPDLSGIEAATFLGGGKGETVRVLSRDGEGNVYAAGWTQSPDLPASGYQSVNREGRWYGDGFIAKFTRDLSSLLALTYIGGSGPDSITSMRIARDGMIYVAGLTMSRDFPIVDGYDETYNGSKIGLLGDGFVAELSPELDQLVASTYLGGSDGELLSSLQIGRDGSIYVAGGTFSSDFPVDGGGYSKRFIGTANSSDAFVVRLSPDLGEVMDSTFIGGSSSDYAMAMAFDEEGNLIVTGYTFSQDFPVVNGYRNYCVASDAWVAKFTPDLEDLLSSTYFGGASIDYATGVTVVNGEIFLAGVTYSPDLPANGGFLNNYVGNGNPEAFVADLSGDLSLLNSATYLGGSGSDRVSGILGNGDGSVYVVGSSDSDDFPVTTTQYVMRGREDAFVVKLSRDLSGVAASLPFGGKWDDAAYDIVPGSLADDFYVGGWTKSPDFPVGSGAYDETLRGCSDAFVARLQGGVLANYPPRVTIVAEKLSSTRYRFNVYLDDPDGRPVRCLIDYTGDGTWDVNEACPGSYFTEEYETSQSGIYEFVVKVTDDVGGEGVGRVRYGISRTPISIVSVNATPEEGFAPLSVTFSVNTVPATGNYYLWDCYGDFHLQGPTGDPVYTCDYTQSGVYVANIIVTDGNGAYELARKRIIVWNRAPIINAFDVTPTIGDAPLQVTLSVVASDPDGHIDKYVWDCYGDGYSLVETSSSTYSCAFTIAARYHPVVRVIDNSGDYSVAQTEVVVKYGGILPPVIHGLTANPITGEAPLSVRFLVDADDPSGSDLKYEWDFDGDGVVDLVSSDREVLHRYDEPGRFRVVVRAIDSYGMYDLATTWITVKPGRINRPPEIVDYSASPTQSIYPAEVSLSVQAVDPDGGVVGYEWDCEGDGDFEGSTAESSHVCRYDHVGRFHPAVRVKDNAGGIATAVTEVTIFGPENLPPRIENFVADPVSGAAPLTVSFSVTAEDPDGRIVLYRWDFDGDGKWDEEKNESDVKYTYENPGDYTAVVEVVDDRGGTDIASLHISVLASGEVSGEEKSNGCGCEVGGTGSNVGDALFFALFTILLLFIRSRTGSGVGDR